MGSQRIATTLRRIRRGSRGASPPGPLDPNRAVTSPQDQQILERAGPYTMTSPARLQALIDAVRYCVARDVPGALAECGVWLGGSVLAMILTLQDLGVEDREIHLYDTFEGMTAPGEHDVSPLEPPALHVWRDAQRRRDRAWPELFDASTFSEQRVRAVLSGTGYPEQRLHLVRGAVEDTLPDQAPERLALLRLDTDWYESTRHELIHLYPRLEDGGVLIVDDYGHWEGCRRAVDEYFAHHATPLLLSRIDYTGRIGVKH